MSVHDPPEDEESFGTIRGFSGRMTLPPELSMALADPTAVLGFLADGFSLLSEDGLQIGSVDTLNFDPVDNSMTFSATLTPTTHEHSLRVETLFFGPSDPSNPTSPRALLAIRVKCMCGHRERYSTSLTDISVPCRQHVQCRGHEHCIVQEPIRLNIDCNEVEMSGGTGA